MCSVYQNACCYHSTFFMSSCVSSPPGNFADVRFFFYPHCTRLCYMCPSKSVPGNAVPFSLFRRVRFVTDPAPQLIVLYSREFSLYPYQPICFFFGALCTQMLAVCTSFYPHLHLHPASVPECLLPVPLLRAHIHVPVCTRMLVASPALFQGDGRMYMFTRDTFDSPFLIFNDFVCT